MDTIKLIDEYMDSKQYAWAPSTLRSELYRLQSVSDKLDGNPVKLWKGIQYQKPYSRLTTWTRVTEYWQWLMDEGKISYGKNPYKEWRTKNARVFKNVYLKKTPEITYQEAKERIGTITDPRVREKALRLLEGGLRFSESDTLRDGTVNGKGSKRRRAFCTEGTIDCGYGVVYRALRKIGIRPHDLRKLFLSRLVEMGANEFELCEVAGWSNLNTASSYIKTNPSRIKKLVEMVQASK